MIQIITLIINLVNNYLMTATNKRLLISESRGDSNQCIPCRGRPDQHDTYASHANPRILAYASCGRSPYVATFHKLSTALDGPYCSREKGLPIQPQPDWVIHRSTTQFLSPHSHWSSNKSQTSIDSMLLGLSSPYHRHAVGTFNTCSRVPMPWFLTDTGRGYHIENLRIATALSPPFPSESSPDPPNGPARSQIIQTTFTNWSREGTSPKSHEWEHPLDFYRNLSSKHSMS
jgi:hypothetical protein